jgi:hypothetical protein
MMTVTVACCMHVGGFIMLNLVYYARSAAEAAFMAALRKSAKRFDLELTHIFSRVHSTGNGSLNESCNEFICSLGHKVCLHCRSLATVRSPRSSLSHGQAFNAYSRRKSPSSTVTKHNLAAIQAVLAWV